MARFKKRVVGSGLYQTPTGPQEVAPSRVKHWHDTIQGMLAAGHKPPLSWGHVRSAVPHPDEHPFWASRYAAGKLTGASLDAAGDLWVEGDAPGVEIDAEGRLITETTLHDGRKVKASLEEVSIGAMDWTDGSGKTWPDAPIHLALTPLPVWVPLGGQPGFQEIPEDEAKGGAANAVRFGTSTLLARFATMASDDTRPLPGKHDDDNDGQKADDDRTKSKPDEARKPSEVGSLDMAALTKALKSAGFDMPESVVDGPTLIAALEAWASAKNGPVAEKTEIPLTKTEDAMKPEAKVEEPGAFLSTIQDPLTRGLVQRAVEADGKARLSRIADLEKRGLPAHVARDLRAESSKAHFGLATDGSLAKHPVETSLAMLEASLPQGHGFDGLFLSSVRGREETPPEQAASPADRAAKTADDIAKRHGLPARVGGAAK